ncbi:DUF397 domain-containing protein [Streptomyces sp. NPDC051658]|uniref:DUF397 domain-containing protein n=1 Tax=Streptomyces sp. NPDC051658 TaxID=3365667 RepID=UPI0037BDBECB
MDVHWRKSSYSADTGSCVEVAEGGGDIFLRESDEPEVIVRVTRKELLGLLAGIRAGKFGEFA